SLCFIGGVKGGGVVEIGNESNDSGSGLDSMVSTDAEREMAAEMMEAGAEVEVGVEEEDVRRGGAGAEVGGDEDWTADDDGNELWTIRGPGPCTTLSDGSGGSLTVRLRVRPRDQ